MESVLQLEEELRPRFQQSQFIRPALLHGDPDVLTEDSLEHSRSLSVPEGSANIGISLGGLIAAKLQESGRDDLHLTAISSPTWADGVKLTHRKARRLSLFSSLDNVIEGRTSLWPQLTEAYDLPWLTHDTDKHKLALSHIVGSYLDNDDALEAFCLKLAPSAYSTFTDLFADSGSFEAKFSKSHNVVAQWLRIRSSVLRVIG